MTDQEEATRAALVAAAREAGLPEIYVPRSIVPVDAVPLLGTGKVDDVNVGRLASQIGEGFVRKQA